MRQAGGSVALIKPDLEHLPAYADALRRGWSPDNGRDVSGEHLALIAADAARFVAELAREDARTVTKPDGTVAPWLPGPTLWMWDGELCGSISLRYQPGSESLPPEVTGHVGYAVVPWKRNRGVARAALCALLPLAAERGLARLLLVCDEDNFASRRVIESNGGVFHSYQPHPRRPVRRMLFWVQTRT